jgi:hypothetical protein
MLISKKKDLKKNTYEHTFFSLKLKMEEKYFLYVVCLYINDLIYTSNDGAMFEKFKRSMMTMFDMFNLEKLITFLTLKWFNKMS